MSELPVCCQAHGRTGRGRTGGVVRFAFWMISLGISKNYGISMVLF